MRTPFHAPQAHLPPRSRGALTDVIVTAIVNGMENGEYPAGVRVPSVRQIAARFDVSLDTAVRAYDRLVAQGRLEARKGSGFYVKAAHSAPQSAPSSWLSQPAAHSDWRSLLRDDLPMSQRLGYGGLPADWLPRNLLGAALRDISRSPLRGIADYESRSLGYAPLREQLRLKLSEQGINAQSDQIISTTGASDALDLVMFTLLRPGDYIAIEDPASFLHLQRAMASGLEPVRVVRRSDGPDLEHLRSVCEAHRPKAFLMSSLLQNPTSTSLSPHKAFQLLMLSKEYNFLIIDDDSFGDLAHPSSSPASTRLATLDQLDRVIHISSFSRTLGPGLRAGFLAASPNLIEQFVLFRSVSTLQSPIITERIVHHILISGQYRHHCDQIRSKLDDIRDASYGEFTKIGCKFLPNRQGFFVWINLGESVNSSKLSKWMIENNYITAQSGFFSSSDMFFSYMRFNIINSVGSDGLIKISKFLKELSS